MSTQAALLAHYAETHPDDLALLIDQLPGDEVAPLLTSMSVDTVAALMPHLAPTQAARGVREMEVARTAAVLTRVPPDIIASLLRRLDADAAARVLDALPADRAAPARALLSYPAASAGGVMDPLVLTAPLGASVADARALISGHSAHLYYYIYVLETGHRLAGVVDIAELLQANPEEPLHAIMHTQVAWLAAESSIDAMSAHPGWSLYDALPVLSDDRRFLGVIRHRRMRQLLAARKPTTPEPGVRTVMALGEIYWLGLCGLLQGIAATAATPRREAP